MDTNAILQDKIDSMKRELRIIALRVRDLVSPLNAVRLYVDDLKEDPECKKIKTRLSDVDRAAGKCMKIIRDLIDLTGDYFK